MNQEEYTPGYTTNAVDFMSKRSLESHGAFFIPHLKEGMTVLDCGCGPGSITAGIAERVTHGRVVGVDADESQVSLATESARVQGLGNVEFRVGSAYGLPFPAESFDAVFSHALLEHLREPEQVITEFYRVLKPGCTLGVCSPDWGGFLLSPPSAELAEAVDEYKSLQTANGGDVYVGRKLSRLLENAGFDSIVMRARYEVYESLGFIGEYLARQLVDAGKATQARTLKEWAATSNGMFAQAWVSCTGQKPATST